MAQDSVTTSTEWVWMRGPSQPICGDRASALTDNDRGYLKGLYRMGTERTLRTQQDEIAYQMEQSLKGK